MDVTLPTKIFASKRLAVIGVQCGTIDQLKSLIVLLAAGKVVLFFVLGIHKMTITIHLVQL